MERVQIPSGSGNFGLLIFKWWSVLHGCGQGVHLATFHLQEDRGLEGLLWEREIQFAAPIHFPEDR